MLMHSARAPDHPLPRGQFGALALDGLDFYLYPATVLVSRATEAIRRSMFQSYPAIARELESGKIVLADSEYCRRHDYRDNSSLWVFNFNGEVSPKPFAESLFTPHIKTQDRGVPDRDLLAPPEGVPALAFGPRWVSLRPYGYFQLYNGQDREAWMGGFIDRDSGNIRLFWLVAFESPRSRGIELGELPPSLPLEQSLSKPREHG